MENNYQLSRIHNYVQGLMSEQDMHALEREALEDPFLQDAIDGYRLEQRVDVKSLSLLQQRLERRMSADAERKNRLYFNWQRLAVGLTAAVMFISICSLLVLRYFPNKTRSSQTEVLLMDDFLNKTSVLPGEAGDAVPVGGWKVITDLISKNYSGLNENQRVHVLFKVNDEGVPYDIQPQVDAASNVFKEVVKILEAGPKWQGKSGDIEIIFPE